MSLGSGVFYNILILIGYIYRRLIDKKMISLTEMFSW